MGYSTCGMHGGRGGPRTCDSCDRCPRCDGVRLTLHRCPADYCPSVRLCGACWAKYGPGLREDNANCYTWAVRAALEGRPA